jgi:hypothetical protein
MSPIPWYFNTDRARNQTGSSYPGSRFHEPEAHASNGYPVGKVVIEGIVDALL